MPNGRNSSRLARLWDQSLPDRLRPVDSVSQFLPDFLQKTCDAIRPLFDHLARHAIRAWCVAASITSQPLPSMKQRSAVAYNVEQIREPLLRVRSTPPIQLALHVENKPGIHRAGQRCPSPARKLYPLLAFAMRTAFPSSDYYASSAPVARGRWSLRPSVPVGAETRAGSQVPPLLLVRFRSRLYPVWIPADGPCRLSRLLISGFPDIPDARPSIANRRSTSLATASPTSESVRNLLTGLRPSVRFPSPWRTRWPGRCWDRKSPHARL